jgi:hypothetical protein
MNTLDEYLDRVQVFLRRYVAFPSEHEPVAIALWVAHAHIVERFDVSPILAVTSAEMRSGKTRVLDCIELLVPDPYRMVMPSEAVFYSLLARRPRPTVLLDEVDALFGPRPSEKTEGLRAVLNAGNRQGTPVLRVAIKGREREIEEFDVFGPKAVAGIGELPATVADRSISIRMRRRAPNERVAKFRYRTVKAEAEAIELPDWAVVPDVPDVPVCPEGLDDRAADSWEPLLAIADIAGDVWPELARKAATVLSAEEPVKVTVGIRLLEDIREVMGDATHLLTAVLLERLYDLEDAPWSDWYGKPLTARALAKLLTPYRVNPIQTRDGIHVVRGYHAESFRDAWSRYLPAHELTGTSGTTGTDAWDPGLANDDTVALAA